jgi:hypothetical protein
MTNEEFKNKVKTIHGDEYDLSKLEFKSWDEKVIIICRKHGEKFISPRALLYKKHGCQECRGEHISKSKLMSTEEFIKRVKKIHGDNFSFEKTNLSRKDENGKIIITCKRHGDIKVLPDNILRGHGCRKCADELNSSKYSMPLDEFLFKAKKIHGEKFLYDKVKEHYKNSHTKVLIGCKKHGYFLQTPNKHLNGQGCPFCNESKLEEEMNLFLIESNITFERSKHFDWLGKQHLDFYLPDYNVAIECQGIQHFEPRDRFGGEAEFKNIIIRDAKKAQLCKENGVKLYYFTKIRKHINENENIYLNKSKLIKNIT